jgi:hypothetical protein
MLPEGMVLQYNSFVKQLLRAISLDMNQTKHRNLRMDTNVHLCFQKLGLLNKALHVLTKSSNA